MGHHGITLNCVAPGSFVTDTSPRTTQASARQAYADTTALGRWGELRELGGPVVLLAPDAGSYITGTTMFVDVVRRSTPSLVEARSIPARRDVTLAVWPVI